MFEFFKTFSMTKIEMIIGLLMFIVALQIAPYGFSMWNNSKPITDWFVVKQLQVASPVIQGDAPVIFYDREIKQSFEASWIAEVQKISENRTFVVCQGNGRNAYKPADDLPVQLEFSWFVGSEKCKLTPGSYRVFAQWNINRGENFKRYKLERLSNIFEVVPRPEVIEGTVK